jgi:protein-tyrosine phosphatase
MNYAFKRWGVFLRRVIFICTGNTCRSPMAQGLFQHLLLDMGIDDILVTSAGIAADEGDTVSENAVAVLSELGIDISSHRAKRLTSEELNEADLIFAMTQNLAQYIFMLNEEIKDKIKIIKDGIPDPYDGSIDEYRACRDIILEGLQEFLEDNKWRE